MTQHQREGNRGEQGRNEREVLRTIMENTQAHLAYLDPQFNFVLVNSAYARGSGHSKEELIGQNHFELFPNPENQAIFEQVRDTGEPVQFHAKPFEYADQPERGTTYWDWRLVPVKDEAGRVKGLVFSLLDVTERVRAEEEHARMAAIVGSSYDAIIGTTPDGTITSWNPGAEHLYGYSTAEAVGRNVSMLIPPERRPELLNLMERLRLGERVEPFETVRLHKDGNCVDVSLTISPIKDAAGRFIGAASITRDISVRKKAEEALRSAKDYAEKLIETANVMIVGLDAAGNISVFNEAAERITGYARQELAGKNWFEVLVPRERYPYVWQIFTTAATGGGLPAAVENPILTKSGEERHISWRNSELREQGRIVGTISFGVDVTEQKRAEAERERLLREVQQERERAEALAAEAEHLAAERGEHLRQLQELDQLKDQFISVAAHELKTPVAIMKGYAQVLLRRPDSAGPQGRRMLEAIDRGSNRIDRVVHDLLDISKLHAGRLELEMERIDLPELVASVVNRMALTATKHTIRLVKAEPVVVRGDRDRLEQVVANLVDNAVKYSPKGGEVDVAVGVRDGEAVVSVRDYGVGIPDEKQSRIFQRFYSAHMNTPYDYGGMGVGLYISKEIVARHGGRMWFESEEGKGSTFYFSLPLTGD